MVLSKNQILKKYGFDIEYESGLVPNEKIQPDSLVIAIEGDPHFDLNLVGIKKHIP